MPPVEGERGQTRDCGVETHAFSVGAQGKDVGPGVSLRSVLLFHSLCGHIS